MKKFLVPALVIALALLIVVPSFALEVKWGGLFRARVLSQHDFEGAGGDYGYGYPFTGSGAVDPLKLGADYNLSMSGINPNKQIPYVQHNNRFDQRLRMYIDFVSSENLKVVTKFETQANWGRTATAQNTNGGNANTGSGNVGADSGTLNVKNVYAEFKIPNTPLAAKVGVQGVALIDSWVIDTDVSGALLVADLKPFTVILGYVSGQNYLTTTEDENIDDLAAVVAYKEGPFSAMLVGLWQDAHNTPAGIFPTVAAAFDDPLQVSVPTTPIPSPYQYMNINGTTVGPVGTVFAQQNNLFDLGLQLGYKTDYLSVYLNAVKNFGSFKAGATGTITPASLTAAAEEGAATYSANYKGWMVDAGVNYFCGPWTVNVGGFYTTGQELSLARRDPNLDISATNPQVIVSGLDVTTFTYPLSTSKYFSEIMGGGILDNFAPNGGYWRGYPNPTNIWTGTIGAAWQVLPQTKLALSYWYFGTSEKVPSRFNAQTGLWSTSSSLGNEIDLNITQNIVDKLNLDLVGAYMFQGDAYRTKTDGVNYNKDDQTYELGARLQWAW